MNEEVQKILDYSSMHHVLPVLCNFPLVGINPYLNVYAIFSVEPLQILHLGLSRMMKKGSMDRLRCTTKPSYSKTRTADGVYVL